MQPLLFTLLFILTSSVHADGIFQPVWDAFNMEALSDPHYTRKIYPPIREEYATQSPWNALGLLQNTTRNGHCTAFVVARDKIMTAQHCMTLCRTFLTNDNGPIEMSNRCALIDPAQESSRYFHMQYLSNFSDFLPELSDEVIDVVSIVKAASPANFNLWRPKRDTLKLSEMRSDWVVLQLDHEITNPNIRPLELTTRSSEELLRLSKQQKIKFFVAGYPHSQILSFINRTHSLRLVGPCILQNIKIEVMEFICELESGGSGGPILAIDETGRIEVVGLVSTVSRMVMRGPHIMRRASR